MQLKTVGVITYHFPHLKTEQVLQRMLSLRRAAEFRIYALPFVPRATRETAINHRPNQQEAVAPHVLAEKHGIPYVECRDDSDIDSRCDVYLVLGAGILSARCVEDKRIINCHPGIIPMSRGLDSFKWAIHEMKPLGVTLHYIDARVDAGEIIAVVPTNVYSTDTIATLARRHYENEIDTLARFVDFLEYPTNPFVGVNEGVPHRRMPVDIERDLVRQFPQYRNKFG